MQNRGGNALIIILLESFESWTVDKNITPNIYNFIYNNDKVIYIKNIQSQIRGGTSSDGQFIVNTGLLPIQKGAVCFRYPYNKYPSISSLFDETAGIFPHGLDVWNQKQMSDAYELDLNYTTSASDKVVFEKVIDVAHKHDFVLAITSQTHTPFEATCDSSGLEVPMALSTHLRNYIKSINYLDEQLGLFFEAIKNDSVLASANIVLTSDHKIFSDDMRLTYKQELDDVHWTYSIDEPYCPLIIYSPIIETPMYDTTSHYYQMDIYPTLINLLKIEDYYWKGLGVNILDEGLENSRIISEDNAYQISDKIIRTNYFENISKSKNK